MRYAAIANRPTANDGGDWFNDRSITVHDSGDDPEPTGLCDAHGTLIYRLRDTVKMGFVKG